MGGAQSTTAFAVEAYRCTASGESPVIRRKDHAQALLTELNGVTTLHANFQHGLKIAGDRPCLGTRTIAADGTAGKYVWQTYKQVATRFTNAGSGLCGLGLTSGDFVGLFSSNCAEWVIAEQACNAYGFVGVPMYDTLGPEAVTFIAQQTELTTVVVSAAKLPILLECQAECPSIRHAIVMDDTIPAECIAAATTIELITLKDLEAAGAGNPQPHNPPKPDDLATICYTSGTTGNPKGAMLTNRSFAASLASVTAGDVALVTEDVHLSYLPLAHMFERIVQAALLHNGAAIGFYQGDVTKLLEDLAELKPTVFPSVPRLFNRIYDKLIQGVALAGGVKKFLFEYAFASKRFYLKDGYVSHKLWDKLVFEKLRALLGGRVRLMITGSAPISGNVKDFLQVVFCAPVYEGYGLTETCAMGTITPTEARNAGHVGIPAHCCEIKLVDIPEMNYLSTDKPNPRGEVCFRGPNVFAGYYKAQDKTDECLEADGWFHTGDVGRLNDDLTLSIIDRKKNIFKLAQGEYIAPEKIENIYCRSAWVAQAFVYGDSLQSQLVGVVVPDPEVVAVWQEENKVSDFAAACASPALKKVIAADMKRVGAEAKLRGFEVVKAFIVEPEPFAVENGMLTPTFKLKRNQLKITYQAEIEAMYASLKAK